MIQSISSLFQRAQLVKVNLSLPIEDEEDTTKWNFKLWGNVYAKYKVMSFLWTSYEMKMTPTISKVVIRMKKNMVRNQKLLNIILILWLNQGPWAKLKVFILTLCICTIRILMLLTRELWAFNQIMLVKCSESASSKELFLKQYSVINILLRECKMNSPLEKF